MRESDLRSLNHKSMYSIFAPLDPNERLPRELLDEGPPPRRYGHPWPGVDYVLVRRVLWLERDVQWRAHRLIHRWAERTYPAVVSAARGQDVIPRARTSKGQRASPRPRPRPRDASQCTISEAEDRVDYLVTGIADPTAAKRYLRNKHRQQPIEPEDTPPSWRSYVSVVSGSRRGFLLGPYASNMMAMMNVSRAKTLARAADPWADFYGYGTCSMAKEVAARVTPVFGR